MENPVADITVLHQLSAVIGYLVGSIPFGLLLTRLSGKGDIREIGSGNIGATNVLRTGSKPLAALTLILDGGKGAAAALLMGQWGLDFALLAGFFAVIGHNFPVWLRFRGGKGVATTIGVLLAFSWPVGLITCGIWLAVAVISRYSSLAALVSLAASPFIMFWLADTPRTVIAALLALLAIARHHENIRRLVSGNESRIGGNK